MKRILVPLSQVLGYLVAVVIVIVCVMVLAKMFIGDWEAGGPRMRLFGDGLLNSVGILITNLLVLRLLGSKDVCRGWPKMKLSLIWLAKGGCLGLCMAGSMLLLTFAFGGATLSFEQGAFGSYVRYAIPLVGCLLIAALGEEWLFRGYPLTRLAHLLGPGWASFSMSLLFAAAHLGSAGVNALALANIVMGSLVVGALRFTPGGIPAAWGFHFMWNCTQVLVGASLSMEGIAVPGVVFSQSGSTLVSGASFGPEAGIGATVSTILVG